MHRSAQSLSNTQEVISYCSPYSDKLGAQWLNREGPSCCPHATAEVLGKTAAAAWKSQRRFLQCFELLDFVSLLFCYEDAAHESMFMWCIRMERPLENQQPTCIRVGSSDADLITLEYVLSSTCVTCESVLREVYLPFPKLNQRSIFLRGLFLLLSEGKYSFICSGALDRRIRCSEAWDPKLKAEPYYLSGAPDHADASPYLKAWRQYVRFAE